MRWLVRSWASVHHGFIRVQKAALHRPRQRKASHQTDIIEMFNKHELLDAAYWTLMDDIIFMLSLLTPRGCIRDYTLLLDNMINIHGNPNAKDVPFADIRMSILSVFNATTKMKTLLSTMIKIYLGPRFLQTLHSRSIHDLIIESIDQLTDMLSYVQDDFDCIVQKASIICCRNQGHESSLHVDWEHTACTQCTMVATKINELYNKVIERLACTPLGLKLKEAIQCALCGSMIHINNAIAGFFLESRMQKRADAIQNVNK